jgi:DNA helicase-2/ATP-dependent DNA helicase PcrA
MNWAVSDIGDRAIVSFSDAHSTPTMGRELTILDAELNFESVRSALFENSVLETVEFHPEHGKYHLNGHRKCDVRLEPEETPPDGRCPVCNRPLTLGVLHRINELSDRRPEEPTVKNGLISGTGANARPFRQLVPLRELIAQGLDVGIGTKKVANLNMSLLNEFENELTALVSTSEVDLASVAGQRVASLVVAVREGRISVEAGFDGVYGTVTALE